MFRLQANVEGCLECTYSFTKEEFERFIYDWNISNPIDRWYRKKYNLRFNSPEHRVCNFIDMAVEFYEDKIFNSSDIEEDKYIPNVGDFIKISEDNLSDEDLISAFSGDDFKE